MKKYFTLLLAALAVTACDHDEIYEEIDFQVQLAPTNTYRVGEPVQFLFGGNADYLVFYSGETGHEYRFRNRTHVAPEDIENCELVVQLNGRSGTPCMSAYVTDAFDGLTLADEAADLATMNGMLTGEKDLEGWTKLDLNDPEKNTEWATTTLDVTDLSDNFCLALHWNPKSIETSQRAYWVSVGVNVKFKGYEPRTLSSRTLDMKAFSMNDEKAGARYILTTENGVNGTMRYTGNTGLNVSEFVLTGSNKYDPSNDKTLPYAIDAWILSTPMSLNQVTPDEGESIKTLSESLGSYSYTFGKPGTYTVTFVATSGNYIDQSSAVKELTVTIIDPLSAE